MGDFEGASAIQALLGQKQRKDKLKADVWVLPHHGAATQTQIGMMEYMNLAKAVMADEIVISSDIKGSYGHPRCETIRNVAPRMNKKDVEFNRVPPQVIENACQTALSNVINPKHEDIIQCWSGSEESRFYESYFCKAGDLGVPRIRQTTQVMNGNSIWNDVITDIVVTTDNVENPNKKIKTN